MVVRELLQICDTAKCDGERVLSTIFDIISKNKLIKLVLINLPNQGEQFDININHITVIFAQIIAFLCL